MSGAHGVRLQWHTQGIDWPALAELFRLTQLAGREAAKLKRAFEKSAVVCFALDGPRLVGAARALSDFEYHATIYDVIVHPAHQRRALGTRIMHELLAALPVWRILLVAQGDVRRFYERLGFEPYGDVFARFDRARLHDP